jgi:protein TonB
MKIITFILWISLVYHQALIAQYDNPPEPILEEEEIKENIQVTFVTPHFPYLSSCENDTSGFNTPKSNSDKKLLNYIYTTLNYPDAAIVNQIEGMVVLSFLVKKEGWVDSTSIKILRDIGHGSGEEALRIVQSFNKELGQWSFHGKPVDTRYNLPIRFKLN